MNSTASLLAGGVLLFGAVALANIYLPALPPATRAETLPRSALALKEAAADKPIIATTHTAFIAADPVAPPAQSPSTQTPGSSAALPAEPAQTTASSSPNTSAKASFANAPTASKAQHEPKQNSSPNVFAQKQPDSPIHRRAQPPVQHVYRPVHALTRAHRARPVRIFRRRTDSARSASTGAFKTPVPHYRTHSPVSKYALSATLGHYAWIRIGNRKTVRVSSGAIVPGLGKVASVSPNIVRFVDGKVLRSKP